MNKAQLAVAAAAMLSIDSAAALYDEPRHKGRFRNNWEQKSKAFGNRVRKRRAKNKVAKQSRRRNRR